jgi:hypothetical protein
MKMGKYNLPKFGGHKPNSKAVNTHTHTQIKIRTEINKRETIRNTKFGYLKR